MIKKIKEDLVKTLHTLARNDSLQIEFSADKKNDIFAFNQDFIDEERVFLPQFQDSQNLDFSVRALPDLAACYLLFHEKALHDQYNFDEDEQKIFDEFEKARVIAKSKDVYFGVTKNILSKIETDIFFQKLALDKASLIFLCEIFSDFISQRVKDFSDILKKSFEEKTIKKIQKLKNKIDDQSAFAKEVKAIIESLRREENQEEGDEKQISKKSKSSLKNSDISNEEKEENEYLSEEKKVNLDAENKKIIEVKKPLTSSKPDKSSLAKDKIEFQNQYKIFTNKFDEVIFPQKLVTKSELEVLRMQLETKMDKLSSISRKMTLKLKKKLLSKENHVYKYEENGVLDRKKFSQIVINPFTSDIFVNRKTDKYQNTVLTILLDNSGSMRGSPIVMSALACEIIAKILEKFSVKTEIIGFTTSDWKGGKSRKIWESSGKNSNPGRLNDVRHIIYKSFNQKFKSSQINLGLMLKEGMLKENIDGEALLFAKARLSNQFDKKKILMVISDGMPVDDSTTVANDEEILSSHLHHVIKNIEKRTDIKIIGVGILHDVKEFYKNYITIKNLEELGDVMIEKIVEKL